MSSELKRKNAILTLQVMERKTKALISLFEAACQVNDTKEATKQRDALHTILDVYLDAIQEVHFLDFNNYWGKQ